MSIAFPVEALPQPRRLAGLAGRAWAKYSASPAGRVEMCRGSSREWLALKDRFVDAPEDTDPRGCRVAGVAHGFSRPSMDRFEFSNATVRFPASASHAVAVRLAEHLHVIREEKHTRCLQNESWPRNYRMGTGGGATNASVDMLIPVVLSQELHQ